MAECHGLRLFRGWLDELLHVQNMAMSMPCLRSWPSKLIDFLVVCRMTVCNFISRRLGDPLTLHVKGSIWNEPALAKGLQFQPWENFKRVRLNVNLCSGNIFISQQTISDYLRIIHDSCYLRWRFFQQKNGAAKLPTLGKKADDVWCPKVLPHSSPSLRSQTLEEPLSTGDHQCMAKNKPGKRKGWHVNLGHCFGSLDVYFTHVLCLKAKSNYHLKYKHCHWMLHACIHVCNCVLQYIYFCESLFSTY